MSTSSKATCDACGAAVEWSEEWRPGDQVLCLECDEMKAIGAAFLEVCTTFGDTAGVEVQVTRQPPDALGDGKRYVLVEVTAPESWADGDLASDFAYLCDSFQKDLGPLFGDRVEWDPVRDWAFGEGKVETCVWVRL